MNFYKLAALQRQNEMLKQAAIQQAIEEELIKQAALQQAIEEELIKQAALEYVLNESVQQDMVKQAMLKEAGLGQAIKNVWGKMTSPFERWANYRLLTGYRKNPELLKTVGHEIEGLSRKDLNNLIRTTAKEQAAQVAPWLTGGAIAAVPTTYFLGRGIYDAIAPEPEPWYRRIFG